MICLAVFDTDKERRGQIKELLTRYTIQRDCELDVLWFSKCESGVIEKYARRIQIAFISLDDENGRELARELYLHNSDALIVFYKSASCEIAPLLESRPRAFHLWDCENETLSDKLDEIFTELSRSYKIFRYQTKRMVYMYPQSSIKYFQSDLKYVRIRQAGSGEDERIFARLADIEKNLGAEFLRIHKSYIVNTAFVERLDKKTHMIYLSDGEELPVSDAQYKRVLMRVSER